MTSFLGGRCPKITHQTFNYQGNWQIDSALFAGDPFLLQADFLRQFQSAQWHISSFDLRISSFFLRLSCKWNTNVSWKVVFGENSFTHFLEWNQKYIQGGWLKEFSVFTAWGRLSDTPSRWLIYFPCRQCSQSSSVLTKVGWGSLFYLSGQCNNRQNFCSSTRLHSTCNRIWFTCEEMTWMECLLPGKLRCPLEINGWKVYFRQKKVPFIGDIRSFSGVVLFTTNSSLSLSSHPWSWLLRFLAHDQASPPCGMMWSLDIQWIEL